MKKILTIFLILFLSVSLFSASWSEAVNRAFTLQGVYGSVVKVTFTKIPTQSSSFATGMPFDIESELVQYNIMEDGREISYWSMVSNTDFKLEITPTKLTSEGTYTDSTGKYLGAGTQGKAELDYIMKFKYSFGYIQNNKQQTSTGFFTINTGSGIVTSSKVGAGETTSTAVGGVYTVELMSSDDTAKPGTIGSVDGSVYFMFTSAASDRIKNDPETVPSGNYTATVTVTVTTEK